MKFDSFAEELSAAGIASSAAEVHGCLAGLCCAGSNQAAAALVLQLFEALGLATAEGLAATLEETAAQVRRELGDGFSFQLLQPDPDAPLEERVEALGEWSQGFLAGIGLVLASASPAKPPLAPEDTDTLSDIAAIARAGLDEASDSEDAERDLLELCEYVRLAAVHLFITGASGGVEAGALQSQAEKDAEAVQEDVIATPAGLFSNKLH